MVHQYQRSDQRVRALLVIQTDSQALPHRKAFSGTCHRRPANHLVCAVRPRSMPTEWSTPHAFSFFTIMGARMFLYGSVLKAMASHRLVGVKTNPSLWGSNSPSWSIVMHLLWPMLLQQMVYSSSVDIRPEWAVVEQIPFTALAKLHYRWAGPRSHARLVRAQGYDCRQAGSRRRVWAGTVDHVACGYGLVQTPLYLAEITPAVHSAGDAEDLAFVGQLHYYDKSYDRVTPKADKPLRRTRRQFRTVTASRDPILQCALFGPGFTRRGRTHVCCWITHGTCANCRRLADEGAGTVFVTDNALTTLMCAPRSVYSWDLVVVKGDGKMWIDRRDQEGALLRSTRS